MARQVASYLEILDPASGGALRRWQNGYVGREVTWDGAPWRFLPMETDGVVSGDPANMSVVIRMPSLSSVTPILEAGLQRGWQAQLKQYEFDTFKGDTDPQAGQLLIVSHRGEIERLAAPTLFSVEMEIGSGIVSSDVPLLPVVMDNARIGAPLRF